MAKGSINSGGAVEPVHTRTTAGTEESQAVVLAVDGTDEVVATPQLAAGERALAVAGGLYPNTTGTLTTATSAVTSGDISRAGNITVAIYGTYAGVNATFEVSPDAGTTWFPVAATREDAGLSETSTGVLAANTTRMWTMSAPGFNRIRVRATAWTSGTANVIIAPGALPIETMVSAIQQFPTTRVSCAFNIATTITAVVAETFLSLQAIRGLANSGAAAASQTVTAGKTLRIEQITFHVTNAGTAAVNAVIFLVHVRAAGGTVATSDPVLFRTSVANPAAVVGTTTTVPIQFGSGLDIAGGASFGVSMIAGSTNGTVGVGITGYEF